MRIWHQSITDLTLLPGYARMLSEHAQRVCDPGTTVELHGIRPGTYPQGMAPIDMVSFPWLHHLAFIQMVENAMRAQAEGYDAVAISCFLDPGMEMARSVVDIPVVSSCETALLVASGIGRAFGLITIDHNMASVLDELVGAYGYRDRVVAIETLDPPLDEYELDQAFDGSPPFVERFSRQARALIARGADVIIPAEGVLNTVLVRNGVSGIDGVPVLDSYGSLLGFAQTLAKLRVRTGLATSRRGRYARPPAAAIEHVRAVTIQVLEESAARSRDEQR